jgi:hypothetical protein
MAMVMPEELRRAHQVVAEVKARESQRDESVDRM